MHRSYSTTSYDGLQVAWLPELDGGGQAATVAFVSVAEALFGRVGHAYEACAGCGFIGFALLGYGLCERLTLSDINPEAVEAMRETVRRNGLQDRVEVHLSDGLADVPRSARFDLVLSNPPWYPTDTGNLIIDDQGWAFHRAFYAGIGEYLTPGASLLFMENSGGADPDLFGPMLAAGGLAHVQTLRYAGDPNPAHYFVWSKALPSEVLVRPMAPVQRIAVEVTDGCAEYELRADAWYRGSVANRLGRHVNLVLSSPSGEGTCLPLPAGATVELPTFVLPPGEHRLRDNLTGSDVATIRVPGGTVRAAPRQQDAQRDPQPNGRQARQWPDPPAVEDMVVELTGEPVEYELPAGVYWGTLVNRLDRDVELVLRDETGRELGGILPLAPGATGVVPNVTLAPGSYTVHDALSGDRMGTVRVVPSA